MVKILTKEMMAIEQPIWEFASGIDLRGQMRPASSGKDGKGRDTLVWEIIQPETFGTTWTTRQMYEIQAGRDSEPLLYNPLFLTMTDENFPSAVQINSLGPGGVVFNQLLPGGETKFANIQSGTKTIPILDYTVGLEYSLRMVVYNEFWEVPIFERQAGVASNALLNHLHLFPFLNANYASSPANQTAASTVGVNLAEKTLRTLEDAVRQSATDMTTTLLGFPNTRRGPYAILCSTNNVFTIERALNSANVIGVDMNSSAKGRIGTIIAYDGWTGIMNGEVTTYPPVQPNIAYLIDINAATRMAYARDLVKFIMRKLVGNEDVSRLVASQEVLWNSLGVYVNPLAMAQQITLPLG